MGPTVKLRDAFMEAVNAFESMKYEPPESKFHRDRLGHCLVTLAFVMVQDYDDTKAAMVFVDDVRDKVEP